MAVYHHYTAEELSALRHYDKDGYDEAMAYRDKILEERSNSGKDERYSISDTESGIMPLEQRVSGDEFRLSISDADDKNSFESVTETQQFKRWFGDWENNPEASSKVVNDDGTPKVMFHGTSSSGFTVFDRYFSKFGLFGEGFYFTDNEEIAASYQDKGKGNSRGNYAVYLNIRNPIDMDAIADIDRWRSAFNEADIEYVPAELSDLSGGTNEDVFRYLKECMSYMMIPRYEAGDLVEGVIRSMGFDGVTHIGGGRYGNKDGPRHRVYIAFESNQIKSATDNIGTFDANEDDIRFSVKDTTDDSEWMDAIESISEDDILALLDVDTSMSIADFEREINKLLGIPNGWLNDNPIREEQLHEEIADRVFEKSGIEYVKADNAFDDTNQAERAKWSKERIDRLYDAYASTLENYSKAYATYISPENFIALTTTENYRSAIYQQSRTLNESELRYNGQEIYLVYDPSQPNEIVGHEGRHRMVALQWAGVKSVPIAVRFMGEIGKQNRQPISELEVRGQEFRNGRAPGYVTLENLTPISRAYRPEIEERFGAGEEYDGVRFSVSDTFASDLDKWKNDGKSSYVTFNVGTTSDALMSIGIESKDLIMRGGKINAILKDHPEITVDILKKIPDILEKPFLIMKSRTVENSIVAYGNVVGENGIPVMVSVLLGPTESGNQLIDVNIVTSAYSRTNESGSDLTKDLILNSDILYVNENGAEEWLHGLGVQFPSFTSFSGPIGIVTYEDGVVKSVEGIPGKDVFGTDESTAISRSLAAAMASRNRKTNAERDIPSERLSVDESSYIDAIMQAAEQEEQMRTEAAKSAASTARQAKAKQREADKAAKAGNRAEAAVAAQEAATLRQEAEAQRIESMTYDDMVDEAMADAGAKPKTPKELVEQAEQNARERLTKRYDQMTPVEKRDELIRSIMRKNGALSGGKTVKVSRVATNTFARGNFFQGVRTAAGEDLQIVVEGLATYNPASEQESVTEAAHRLDTDYMKWFKGLPVKEQWSGVDHDTAMMILSQLQKESAGSGDYTEVIRWAKIIQQHGTTAAQALQSFAKYTRTATGIMMKQLDLIEQIAENQKLSDAKKQWMIRQTIDYANLIDRVQEGDKEGLVDVIIRILGDRGTKVSKFGKNRFMKQDFQYLSNFSINALASLSDDYRKRGFGEKLSAWQYIAQLGNLRTGLRNITSNTAFYGLESVANNTVGILADTVVGALTGKRSVGMTWLAKGDKSTWQGMKDRGRASYLQVKYDVSGDESKSKYEGRSSNRTFKIAQRQIIRSNLEMLNGLSLNVSDELFKGATYQSMFNSYAKFVADGKLTLEEAIQLSEDEMKYRTFQDDTLPGKLLNKIHNALNVIGTENFGLGDIVVKYRTVPGALIDRAIEFSPLGLVKVIYHTGMLVKSGGQNVLEQREVSMGFARTVTGTTLAAVFALLAKNGVLKRKEDEEDKNVSAMEGAEGRTGTQINLSAIGRYLSGDENWSQWREGDALQDIGFLDPIGSSITWGALFNQKFCQEADGLLASVMGASVSMATSAFTDLSMMDTVNDIIYAVMYGGDSEYGRGWSLLTSFATSFVTGLEPSLIRQIAQASDNYYRDTYATGGFVNQLLGDIAGADELQGMANSIMLNIPGLRQMVPTKLDPFGNEKTYGNGVTAASVLNTFLNPGRFNRLSETELQQELKAVYDESGDASFYPDRNAPNSLSFGKDADGNDVKVTMTYDQKREYLQTVGDTYKEILAETMGDQRYIAASSTEKAEMLKEIKEYSEYKAKQAYNDKYGINPDWENSKWEKTEMGMDAGFGFSEMRGILSDVGAFESEKDDFGDAKPGSIDDQVLDYLNKKRYTDEEKLMLYGIINGGIGTGSVRRLNILMSDSEFTYEYHGESITAQGAGLTFNDAVSVIQEYHKLRAEGSQTALNEQTEMNRWLRANGYSDEQIGVINENYKFYGMIPQQEDSTMAKLNAAGIDSDTAYNIAGMLAGLEPEEGEETVSNTQKYDAILGSRISDAEKQAAIAAVQGKNSMFGDLDTDTASSLMKAYQDTGNTDYINFNAGEQCTIGGVVYEYTDEQKATYKETYLSAISTLARGVDVSGSYTNVNGNRTPLIDQIKVISSGYAAAAALRGSGVALTEESVKNNDSLNKYWKVSTAQQAYGISPGTYLMIWAGAQEVNYAGTNADVRDYIKSMVGSGQPYNYMCYALGVSLKTQRLALGYSS